jgi:hypothetical protein
MAAQPVVMPAISAVASVFKRKPAPHFDAGRAPVRVKKTHQIQNLGLGGDAGGVIDVIAGLPIHADEALGLLDPP